MPRRVQRPPIISVEVDGVVENFNGFFDFPLEIIVLYAKDLGLLQTNMMFGGRGVLIKSRFEDPIMTNFYTMLTYSGMERTTSFTNVGGTT